MCVRGNTEPVKVPNELCYWNILDLAIRYFFPRSRWSGCLYMENMMDVFCAVFSTVCVAV